MLMISYQIAPPANDDFDTLLNNLQYKEDYKKYTNEGDLQTSTTELLNLASILNAESRHNRKTGMLCTLDKTLS